jgi:hypothetical protein
MGANLKIPPFEKGGLGGFYGKGVKQLPFGSGIALEYKHEKRRST